MAIISHLEDYVNTFHNLFTQLDNKLAAITQSRELHEPDSDRRQTRFRPGPKAGLSTL